MPYIPSTQRSSPGSFVNNAGELNFQITSLVDSYLYDHGITYTNINTVIGVLQCAQMELYRRVAAVYEDKKMKENGDVYICIEKL